MLKIFEKIEHVPTTEDTTTTFRVYSNFELALSEVATDDSDGVVQVKIHGRTYCTKEVKPVPNTMTVWDVTIYGKVDSGIRTDEIIVVIETKKPGERLSRKKATTALKAKKRVTKKKASKKKST